MKVRRSKRFFRGCRYYRPYNSYHKKSSSCDKSSILRLGLP